MPKQEPSTKTLRVWTAPRPGPGAWVVKIYDVPEDVLEKYLVEAKAPDSLPRCLLRVETDMQREARK